MARQCELKRVQNTVNNINRSTLEIGSMEIKKHEMNTSYTCFIKRRIHVVEQWKLKIDACLQKHVGFET